MKRIRVPAAAKEMGVCRQRALQRLKEKQRNHPGIQILIPRESPTEKWWVDLDGLRRARELERSDHVDSIENRVAILESTFRITRQKVDRLAMRVYGRKNAE